MGEWVQEQQAKVDKAKAMLQRVRERQWNKKNKHRVPATYQEGDWVLVHHVSAANPHLPRFSLICLRLAIFWSFSLLRRNRRPAAQSQDQTYIFLMCRI